MPTDQQTIPAISTVEPRPRSDVQRTYRRVAGANILFFEPAEVPPETAHLILVSMHGGLNPTLEQPFLERVAAYGIRTAYCVPDKRGFVDQFRAVHTCMQLFRQVADTVVLMGQSRGAALMSGYQRLAENGSGAFQGPERRLPLPDLDLEPADGIMLLDANFGTTLMHVMSLNPALGPGTVDPADAAGLDPLDPANGYAADGAAHYDEDFRRRFLAAQRDRYVALLDLASERWTAIAAGEGEYSDDEPFVVADGIGINNSPKLFAGDLSYLRHTRGEWPLVHGDGTITHGVVPCVRVDENNPGLVGTSGAAFVSTVRDYLWTEITVDEHYDYDEDSVSGVDFDSAFTSPSGNVRAISKPLLVMGHTGGYEYIAAEWEYERAASADRTIAFVEGATHGWTSLDPERFGDTLDVEARYVGQWLGAPGRFPATDGTAAAAGRGADGSVGTDVPAVRRALVGTWANAAGDSAAFGGSGSSEVSFQATWTRFDVDARGVLSFNDRYGDTVELQRVDDVPRAAGDGRVWAFDGATLVLAGVVLTGVGATVAGTAGTSR